MNSQTYHQQEMEQRIRRFDDVCEIAIDHIRNLKIKARSFLDQLSCEPTQLKNRFLQCTRQLDEFTYLITEFNLTASNLDAEKNTTPNQATKKSAPPPNNKRSDTRSRSNTWRSGETKASRKEQKTKTVEQNWRYRGSDSDETRSIQNEETNGNNKTTEMQDIFADCQPLGLPPQPKLDPASDKATIITANGAQLWLIFDVDILTNLILEMAEYYKKEDVNPDYIPQRICAYYDEAETKCFLRALYIDSEEPEVFLVDTGEFQPALKRLLRPLHPKFCVTPPLAHLCCLADVDQTEDMNIEARQTEFLKQFLGQSFKVKLKMDDIEDDNPSQAVSLYLYLDDGRSVNELLVQALASNKPDLNEKSIYSTSASDKNTNISPVQSKYNTIEDKYENDMEINSIDAPKNNIHIDNELEYSKCPEYENAVEAVTGYSNRDEMDICKHYTGGDGCFKGHRCKKRHILMHPDGWTLDRVSVPVKCRPAALPAPGTRHKVKVTHVDKYCRLYVQFEQEDELMSLSDLVEEMTRAAADSPPLKLEPALGELVSTAFSDGRYYRARVLASDEQKTEVMYIDFGNTSTVPNSDLRGLESRWLVPARAVGCRLGGLDVSDAGTAEMLQELALDKTMEAHIIARGYDELTVKLIDDGFDIAEQLAAFTGIELKPYKVEDDSQRLIHHVPA